MLRFTIRDVLWLTLVVGLAVSWWVDRGRLAEFGRTQKSRADVAESDHQKTKVALHDAVMEMRELLSSNPSYDAAE